MNTNILKIFVTLLLPCLLIAGNSQASAAPEHFAIIAAVQTSSELDGQQQHLLGGPSKPAPTVAMLQEAKIKSRLVAASFAYRQSILATSKNELDAAYAYLQEAVQLHPSNLDYLQSASRMAFALGKYHAAETYQFIESLALVVPHSVAP